MPDLPSRFTGPGLVDLQVNGYAGFDFNSNPDKWSADDFRKTGEALRKRGVVAVLPTFITDDFVQLMDRVSKYSALMQSNPDLQSRFPGLHIEGPFISPNDGPRGAHPVIHCKQPSEIPEFFADLISKSGNRISMITLAPELKGAMELIEMAEKAGICAAIGHTEAGSETIAHAIRAGAKISTHLGNGSHQILPRHANYIQVQLAMDELFASFIADGHHIPFYALKNYIRSKGVVRSILVTDAMEAADKGAGTYKLGKQNVIVREDLLVRVPGQPNLAGSALTLDRAVINVATHCDVPFETAWRMASVQPASLVGLTNLPEITVEVRNDAFRLVDDSG